MATRLSKFDTTDAASHLPRDGQRRQSVLVVANDERILQAYARCLTEAGLHVSMARTGFEAIVKASCQLPDAIVMQEGLLAGEGVSSDAARELIGVCPATSHIPVICYPARDLVDAGAIETAELLSVLRREFAQQ